MENAAGGGWVLYGSMLIISEDEQDWTKLAEMSVFVVGSGSIVTVAEMEASL